MVIEDTKIGGRKEHINTWWGMRPCMRCNPKAVPADKRPLGSACMNCEGHGWTENPAMTESRWNEIIPNLWVGGHDYLVRDNHGIRWADAHPEDKFDVVVSMYRRDGYAPTSGEHYEFLFRDVKGLTEETIRLAHTAADVVAGAVYDGKKTLVRCQAGINRSSFVAALAMMSLGYSGDDSIDLIRTHRTPWALCNESFEAYLRDDDAVESNREYLKTT